MAPQVGDDRRGPCRRPRQQTRHPQGKRGGQIGPRGFGLGSTALWNCSGSRARSARSRARARRASTLGRRLELQRRFVAGDGAVEVAGFLSRLGQQNLCRAILRIEFERAAQVRVGLGDKPGLALDAGQLAIEHGAVWRHANRRFVRRSRVVPLLARRQVARPGDESSTTRNRSVSMRGASASCGSACWAASKLASASAAVRARAAPGPCPPVPPPCDGVRSAPHRSGRRPARRPSRQCDIALTGQCGGCARAPSSARGRTSGRRHRYCRPAIGSTRCSGPRQRPAVRRAGTGGCRNSGNRGADTTAGGAFGAQATAVTESQAPEWPAVGSRRLRHAARRGPSGRARGGAHPLQSPAGRRSRCVESPARRDRAAPPAHGRRRTAGRTPA